MFTGIIEAIGHVVRTGTSALAIRTSLTDVKAGDSVAVNGVCLTVTDIEQLRGHSTLHFDFSPETRARTTIISLRNGSPVNLERALRVGDRLGGHIMTGHIEGTGVLLEKEHTGHFWSLRFSFDKHLQRLIVPKGSVAVDGISLTVVECSRNSFSISVVPHTMEKTTLGQVSVGQKVNLEPDILAKYVDHMLRVSGPTQGISRDFLREHRFIHG